MNGIDAPMGARRIGSLIEWLGVSSCGEVKGSQRRGAEKRGEEVEKVKIPRRKCNVWGAHREKHEVKGKAFNAETRRGGEKIGGGESQRPHFSCAGALS